MHVYLFHGYTYILQHEGQIILTLKDFPTKVEHLAGDNCLKCVGMKSV